MKRVILAATTVLALCGTPAQAAGIEANIVAQLRGQGYTFVQVTRTWLGRIRIDAKQGDVRREIVINPNTGEILRDYQGTVTRVADESDDSIHSATAIVGTPTVGASSDEGGTPLESRDTSVEKVTVPDLTNPVEQAPADGG